MKTEAGVGDAHPVRCRRSLLSFDQERLDHDTDDAGLPARDLVTDIGDDLRLPSMILATVAMRRIDNDPREQPCVIEPPQSGLDGNRVMVRAGDTAAEYEMPICVASTALQHRDTDRADTGKHVLMGGHLNRIDRGADIPLDRVLAPDGHRQP